ncbi:hypothetical protein H310_01920 [Aphanomyces invadans]|uniref:Uncharacterized protein n=1 Tax=Aphanomyces invadans TaxID=157072 RepID=A0A024UMN3_9STRA|nr:hypothetical protein H310_01920 [Aphanomyces invadans]ETW07395.1 hypothetical protein H310_01920 [Aphanomyces invadans]|eukprot:XP_008863488.1 hypothetical protein H310_01920 [Aphanomyces invadans]
MSTVGRPMTWQTASYHPWRSAEEDARTFTMRPLSRWNWRPCSVTVTSDTRPPPFWLPSILSKYATSRSLKTKYRVFHDLTISPSFSSHPTYVGRFCITCCCCCWRYCCWYVSLVDDVWDRSVYGFCLCGWGCCGYCWGGDRRLSLEPRYSYVLGDAPPTLDCSDRVLLDRYSPAAAAAGADRRLRYVATAFSIAFLHMTNSPTVFVVMFMALPSLLIKIMQLSCDLLGWTPARTNDPFSLARGFDTSLS